MWFYCIFFNAEFTSTLQTLYISGDSSVNHSISKKTLFARESNYVHDSLVYLHYWAHFMRRAIHIKRKTVKRKQRLAHTTAFSYTCLHTCRIWWMNRMQIYSRLWAAITTTAGIRSILCGSIVFTYLRWNAIFYFFNLRWNLIRSLILYVIVSTEVKFTSFDHEKLTSCHNVPTNKWTTYIRI